MSEVIRMSTDPSTPNQRIRVTEELDEWGTITIRDEDLTSACVKAQAVSKTTVILTTDEARWLRDHLIDLNLDERVEPQ